MRLRPFSLFAIALFLSHSVTIAQVSGPNYAWISVKPEVVRCDTVAAGSNGHSSFVVFNKGEVPLQIHAIKTAHGGLVASCNKALISPGDSMTVGLRYDTNRLGPLNTSVTIESNAANTPTLFVRVMGFVKQ
ncbi:MAG: DUF1573 domain-containing protein [Flavobacteriales bacterium]|nr:DUF1573 domain-containing protein [Flavobacteriales bacterium]